MTKLIPPVGPLVTEMGDITGKFFKVTLLIYFWKTGLSSGKGVAIAAGIRPKLFLEQNPTARIFMLLRVYPHTKVPMLQLSARGRWPADR